MSVLLAVLGVLLALFAVTGIPILPRRGKRAGSLLHGITELLFVTTQVSALVWVFISYGIAIYAAVRLGQVYTMAELSEPAIHTILGVGFLKVLENIFEHNDSPVFGRSKKENPPGGGEEDTYGKSI